MSDWWNYTPSVFDREGYQKRLMELERIRKEEEERMAAEDALIEATTDPHEKLRLRRERYECEEYLTLDDLPKWSTTLQELDANGLPKVTDYKAVVTERDTGRRFPVNEALNNKVYLHRGDITELELDAIVNAANESLLGGGGIDGAIHAAAGPLLVKECRTFRGCETGQTKITKGYSLPAKYVLHTVGPMGRGDAKLQSCYKTCLDLAKEKGIRTIAFCCVGTGVYSFPLVRAAHIALRCVREWMDANPDALDGVVFCVFTKTELDVYQCLMPSYFPAAGFPAREADAEDQDAVPITEATIAAEAEAEKREYERQRMYYRKWLAASPTDEDEHLKAHAVPRSESGASLYE